MSFLKVFQPFPLEKDHVKHADGDGCIRKVEDGPEKDEMVVGAEEEVR